jgi:hypothetical protein
VELRLHAHSGAVARKIGRDVFAKRRRLPAATPQPPAFFVGRTNELAIVVGALSAGERIVAELIGRDGAGKTTFIRQLLTDPVVASLDGVVLLEGSAGRDDILQHAFDAVYEGERRFMPIGVQRDQLMVEPRLLVVIDDFIGSPDDAAYLTAQLPSSSFIFTTTQAKLASLARAIELPPLNTDDAQALSLRTKGGTQTLDSANSLTAILSATPLEIVQSSSIPRDPQEAPVLGDALLDRLVSTVTATESVLLSALVVTGGGPLGPKMIGRLAGLPNAMPMLESLERRGIVDFDGERYRLRPAILERVPVVVTLPRLDGSLAIFEEWLRGTPTTSQVIGRAQAVNRLLAHAITENRSQEVLVIGPMLANALTLAGELDRARATLDIVLKAARTIPDRDFEAWALHQSGTLAFVLGDEVAGQTLLSQALEIRSRLNDEPALAATRHNLSMILGIRPTTGSTEDNEAAANKPNRLFVAILFAVCAGLAILFALKIFSRPPEQQVVRPVHHSAPKAHHEQQAAPAAVAPVGPVEQRAEPVAHPAPVAHPVHKAKPKPHHAPRSSAPPQIDAFYASPGTASVGEYAQLCFSIANASSATIDGIGSVPARGTHCVTIKPDHSATYTLTASNASASVRAFTTLSVTATMQVRPE